MPTAKGWSRKFDDPIPLPDGGELRTLLDAGRYVDALPPSTHEREEWQTVMEVLLSAVEGREPVRLVHIALTLALWPCRRANDEGSATQARQEMTGRLTATGSREPDPRSPSLKGAQPMKFVEPSHFTIPQRASYWRSPTPPSLPRMAASISS